jgi:L-amino acid N-acyltransferase YncA
MTAVVRLASDQDAEGVRAIYAPFVRDTAISFEIDPPTEDEMRQRIRALHGRLPWLVCTDGADLLGYAYGDLLRTRLAYRWSAEVTVYVSPAHQRRGVGQALYTSLLSALRLLGYRNAFAVIALPNPASVGLHEALGFRSAGVLAGAGYKLERWHDVGTWQLALLPLDRPESSPLTVAEAAARPAWTAALASGVAHLRPARVSS